jgi:hypothetical protein
MRTLTDGAHTVPVASAKNNQGQPRTPKNTQEEEEEKKQRAEEPRAVKPRTE